MGNNIYGENIVAIGYDRSKYRRDLAGRNTKHESRNTIEMRCWCLSVKLFTNITFSPRRQRTFFTGKVQNMYACIIFLCYGIILEDYIATICTKNAFSVVELMKKNVSNSDWEISQTRWLLIYCQSFMQASQMIRLQRVLKSEGPSSYVGEIWHIFSGRFASGCASGSTLKAIRSAYAYASWCAFCVLHVFIIIFEPSRCITKGEPMSNVN